MSDKTKAALQSCQCHYQMFKQKQNTRLHAGGQSLSELQNSNSVLVGFSLNRGEVSKTYIRQWRTLDHTAKNYPEVGHYSLSDSFAFLRCRRLISPWTAALINWPVLSPGSLSCSIPSISSWAILAVTDCDFEFFGPVAISTLHCNWCKTIYTKFWGLKVLTCKTPLIYLVSYTLLRNGAETAKPGSGGTLAGPLTKPLSEVTTMAELQSTQTRPEFTWLFLATPKHYPECAPVVLRFDADTETNARAAFPGWELVFAAKIRAQAPCRVSFFDYSTRRGWEFDSASIQEVHHG